MYRHLLPLLILTLLLFGCEQKRPETQQTPASPQPQLSPLSEVKNSPRLLLQEPVEVELVENAAEAIPTWRKYAKAKPTLIILAKNPLLQPVPALEANAVRERVYNATKEEISRASQVTQADVTLFPNMSLSAVLAENFFSEVVWVLPMPSGTSLTLEGFRKKMLSVGDLTTAEAESFSASETGFRGKVRGIPFRVTNQEHLPEVEGPIILHLDHSYLSNGYKNEIRTPLYKYVRDQMAKLKQKEYQVHAVTLCPSNLSGEISLRTRFLGPFIASLLQDPARLEAKPDPVETLRSEALYLENFFKKEEVLAINRKLVEVAPADPAAHYDLYQTLRQHQKADEALEQLKQAVELDPVYAMEYLQLAELAVEKRISSGVIKMLEQVRTHFPDNLFIRLELARLLADIGQEDHALALLRELQTLPWSKTYHKRVREQIEQFSQALTETLNAKKDSAEETKNN